MNRLPPPTATVVLTRCTSRGSNPDQRILSPPLSPLKVLVPIGPPHPNSTPRFGASPERNGDWLDGRLSHARVSSLVDSRGLYR